jgi:hypothetical protein
MEDRAGIAARARLSDEGQYVGKVTLAIERCDPNPAQEFVPSDI